MNAQETAIAKIRQLPEPLLKLVNDFLDVLLKFNLPSEASSSFTAPDISDAPKPARAHRKPGAAVARNDRNTSGRNGRHSAPMA